MEAQEAKDKAKKMMEFLSRSLKNTNENDAEDYIKKFKATSNLLKEDIIYIPLLQYFIDAKRTELKSETTLKNRGKLSNELDELGTILFSEFDQKLNDQNERDLEKFKEIFKSITKI